MLTDNIKNNNIFGLFKKEVKSLQSKVFFNEFEFDTLSDTEFTRNPITATPAFVIKFQNYVLLSGEHLHILTA